MNSGKKYVWGLKCQIVHDLTAGVFQRVSVDNGQLPLFSISKKALTALLPRKY
jgi:hypothetical protein